MADDVVVARLGRPHGIRGEMSIEVRTDRPEARFVPGAVFATDPDREPLTVARVRDHNGVLLLHFEQVPDRTAAEAIRNTLLLAPADAAAEEDDDSWYEDDLVGLQVRLDGRPEPIGSVVGLKHGAAQDILVVQEDGHDRVMLPFVRALVPVVDVAGGFVQIDPPGGLFNAVPEEE